MTRTRIYYWLIPCCSVIWFISEGQWCGSGMIFLDPDPIFQLASDPKSVSRSGSIYYFCIPIYYWQDEKELIFLNWAFLLRNCQILSVFQSSLLVLIKIHFFRIRSCPDRDPAKSFGSGSLFRSTTLQRTRLKMQTEIRTELLLSLSPDV